MGAVRPQPVGPCGHLVRFDGQGRGLRALSPRLFRLRRGDRAQVADWAPGHATGDRSAQTVQVAGRVRAEVADHALVVHQAPDHALAQAAFLELAFLEGLAEVAAPVGQDEV